MTAVAELHETGPVLDAKIAFAVGRLWAIPEFVRPGISKEDRETLWRVIPRYSAGLGAAMEAAESFGLLDCYKHDCSLSYDGHPQSIKEGIMWVVWGPDGEMLAHGDTGPLAICRAILAIKEKQ